MEMLENAVIFKIKSRFLDLCDVDDDVIRFEKTLENMINVLEDVLGAKEIHFSFCLDWKERLTIDGINLVDSAHLSGYNADSDVSNITSSTVQPGYSVSTGKETIGYLTFYDYDTKSISTSLLEKVGHECGIFIKKALKLSRIVWNEKKSKLLIMVTEKFHSSMDIDEVLEKILSVFHEVYSGFTYSLFLSHDSHSNSHLPIKKLQYDSENTAAMEAYLTGMVQIDHSLTEQRSVLYAPLKGRQGVYGVLQIATADALDFPKNEVDFISRLANTAGNALENAILYQQSKGLIADLKLINEVSRRLNSNLRFSDTVTYMCNQIKTSFSAEEVGFIFYTEGKKNVKVLEGSTKVFFSKKVEAYIHYFQDRLQLEKSSVFFGDFNLLNDKQYRSVMAIPMVQTGLSDGFILVMNKNPYQFSFESYKLLQSLIHHSTLAFANSTLREELERMVVTDYLTKLYSRNYLDQKIQQSMREDGQGAFILIDIDNFKGINDRYGHQVGDEVLIQVANVIRANIRDSDIGARWGGEELAIYLPKVTIERGNIIAARLLERVRVNTNPTVTISCGVSHWNKRRIDNIKQLFFRADEALYLAKTSGKNTVVSQKKMKA